MGQPPRISTFGSFVLLSDHIQALPYGEENLSWILTLLTPQTAERFSQLPWNVQWRIWLRNECCRQSSHKGENYLLLGEIDSIVVAVQGVVLHKSLVGDDNDHHHHHDLLLTTHSHQRNADDNNNTSEPWTKDFMLKNWSSSQRYHVYRDVHKCWRNWDPDRRRDVDLILHGLDHLLLDSDRNNFPGELGNFGMEGNQKQVSESESMKQTKENSPLDVLQRMRGVNTASPEQICRQYWQQRKPNAHKNRNDVLPPQVDKKPFFKSTVEFKTWMRVHLSDLPDLNATKEGLQRLCRHLGEQGADSTAYQSVQNMENSKEIFARAASIRVDDAMSYKGLSLLRSATTPDFVPDTSLKRLYKPLPRVENDVDVNVVCGIIESQLAIDDKLDDALCPDLKALAVLVWDYLVVFATKSSSLADEELTQEPKQRSDLSRLYNAIVRFRSWLPLETILPRLQYLLHLIFEAEHPSDNTGHENDDVSWKKRLKELLHHRKDSLRFCRTLLCSTTHMFRLLNMSSETQELQWQVLFNRDVCTSLHNLSFAFSLVLSMETAGNFYPGSNQVPEVFRKFFLLCGLVESVTLVNNDVISRPLVLPPHLVWLFRVIGVTATIPVGTILPQSLQSVGPDLAEQYQQVLIKSGFHFLSEETATIWPCLEGYVKALVSFCHQSAWNAIECKSWCNSIAHATFRLANDKTKLGRLWITVLGSYLNESSRLGEGETERVKMSSMLRCLHGRMAELIWQSEPGSSGLAMVLLDAVADAPADQSERLSCSLSCIIRSSPPDALFRGINPSTDEVDKVLNTFARKNLEAAGVIFLGVALYLGQSRNDSSQFESQRLLQAARNFVRDCSNGVLGNDMVRIRSIKDRVERSLQEHGSVTGMKWWSNVFPSATQITNKLIEERHPHIERTSHELERKIQALGNRQAGGQSRGHQRRQLRSPANEAPQPSIDKGTRRKRLKLGKGIEGNIGFSPPMVHSAPEIKTRKRNDDNIILFESFITGTEK